MDARKGKTLFFGGGMKGLDMVVVDSNCIETWIVMHCHGDSIS